MAFTVHTKKDQPRQCQQSQTFKVSICTSKEQIILGITFQTAQFAQK